MLALLNFQGQIPVIRGPPFCGASFLSLVQLMGEKQPAIWGRGGGGCADRLMGPYFLVYSGYKGQSVTSLNRHLFSLLSVGKKTSLCAFVLMPRCLISLCVRSRKRRVFKVIRPNCKEK